MFIRTEETPNPATLKFLPGRTVMESGVASFSAQAEAGTSPLAARLLSIDGVVSVFFGADFITLTKAPEKEWYLLKPPVLGAIMEHFVMGNPLFLEENILTSEFSDDELSAEIRALIDTRIRPAVAMDGGDISFIRFEDGIVYVRLSGSCSGCPSSSITLKQGIESMLQYYVPEVVSVVAED